MPYMSILLSDSLLAAALAGSMKRKISLESFIEDAIRAAVETPADHIRPPVNLEDMLQNALRVAESKQSGETFLVQEICDPRDWEATTAGERKVFGKRFRKLIEDPNNRIASHVDRTSSNQAVYRRL